MISFEQPDIYDLFLAGDFCPNSDVVVSSLKISASLSDLMGKAKLRMVNLECPITKQSQPIAKSGPALKCAPGSINLLSKMGIDVCNLANNHVMDFGYPGARDTMETLKQAEIEYLGLSTGEETTYIRHINGKKVAFVSFTENEFSTLPVNGVNAIPMDYALQMRQIKKAKEIADFVVVQYHGGAEQYRYPSPGQKKYTRYLADLGASLVVCHHSHCYSGWDVYNGVPIFYGLGNYFFPEEGNPESWYTGLALCVTFDTQITVNLVPIRLDISGNSLEYDHSHLAEIEAEILEINSVITTDERLSEKWLEFCVSHRYSVLKRLFSVNRVTGALIKRGFLDRFFDKKVSLGLLNILRCETHYEKLIRILHSLVYHK